MTSCGFAVPLLHEAAKGARAMDGNCTTNANDRALEEAIPPGFRTREMLERQYLEFLRKDKRFLENYRKDMNRRSLDGLPGLRTARRDKGEWLMWEDLKVGIWRLLRQWDAIMLGVVFTLSSMMALRAFNVKV